VIPKRFFLLAPGLAALVMALSSGAQPTSAGGPGPGYDFTPVTTLVQDAVTDMPLNGASLLIFKDGASVYEQYFGSYNAATVVPIASSTKWISSSVFMTLVDDGIIGLDDPVSMYLPNWTGQMGTITMRQLWSFTSGLPGDHACLGDQTMTLATCVEQIRLGGLIAAPGTQFYYGGASMQVAGRVAEVATGQSWLTLWYDRLKTPLGMTNSGFGPVPNPQIGGGMGATLGEYSKLLQMHLGRGVFNGQRVLSPGAVIEMQKDQTFGVPLAYTPHPDPRRYGLGIWRDVVNGQAAVQLSSQGKFGFSPWLDNDRDYFGIFMVEDDYIDVYLLVAQIQALVRGILDGYDTDVDGVTDSADTDDDNDGYSDTIERRYPLCGNGLNDDSADDVTIDDGCPAGPAQSGAFSEGEFRITTWNGDPCGLQSWPSDFISGGVPDSTNRVNVLDLSSFLAPSRRLDSNPGSAAFSSRWDLVPGKGFFATFININDMSALLAGSSGFPPMLGGARAFSGPVCPG
jgi:CubicO group peptidase (beta-lactamase class C family)